VDNAANEFVFMTNPSLSNSVDNRSFPPMMTKEWILDYLLETLRSKTESGTRALRMTFQRLKNNRYETSQNVECAIAFDSPIFFNRVDETINLTDLKRGLKSFGLSLTNDDAQYLLNAFDTNRDGSISMSEFLRTLSGDMPEAR